jgi:polar amino acid transport system substrate-binding protein
VGLFRIGCCFGLRLPCGLLRSITLAIVWTALFLSATRPAEAVVPVCQQVILTGDPDYPPFSWYANDTFRGSAIEIATLALKRIGLPHEIRYVGPFPKVLDAAREGTVDLIAELKNTPERAQYLSFSKVPLFTNPVAVFTRVDQALTFNRWDDLVGLRGGVTLGHKFGGGFDEFIADRLTVEPADRISLNFSKLGNGRIDYFVNSYYPALAYLIRERREAQFKVLQPFATATDNFVGWSKASACINKLREFDAALAAMVRSGEVRRILDANVDQLRQGRMSGRTP